MTTQHALYDITEADRALAREYKFNPDGPHRPDVVRLLNRIFWTPVPRRPVVVCTRSHREWRLGRLSGVRGQPIEVLDEPVYTDRALAMWAVFEMRWEMITGQPLEL